MKRLSPQEIQDLLALNAIDIAPELERRLAQQAKQTVQEFFLSPAHSSFVNHVTLDTDARCVMVRLETLQSLLRASQSNRRHTFRYEGFQAGVGYGLAVIKWFLQRTEGGGIRGLPGDALSLLRSCAAIDSASGWGNIKIVRGEDLPNVTGWSGTIEITDNFLVAEVAEPSAESETRHKFYREFWNGYLEGTFCAALGAWAGKWAEANRDEFWPLLYAECTVLDNRGSGNELFELRVCEPNYRKTFLNIQRELLCPFVEGNTARIASRARAVVESWIRELAKTESHPSENMVAALTWLAHNVPHEAKSVLAEVQRVRDLLHEGVHEAANTPTLAQARSLVGRVAGSLMMACRDIRLSTDAITTLNLRLRDPKK